MQTFTKESSKPLTPTGKSSFDPICINIYIYLKKNINILKEEISQKPLWRFYDTTKLLFSCVVYQYQ